MNKDMRRRKGRGRHYFKGQCTRRRKRRRRRREKTITFRVCNEFERAVVVVAVICSRERRVGKAEKKEEEVMVNISA